MNTVHKELASGRWFRFSFFEQMANIGSEIERTIKWRQKGNQEYKRLAFERALELLDLSIEDTKNQSRSRLREMLRTREALTDFFAFDNFYMSTEQSWQKYFYSFNYAAHAHK